MSPPYLLPLDTKTITLGTLAALRDIEADFDLDTARLNRVLDQFLWEYKKGLTEYPDAKTRDTFTYVTVLFPTSRIPA